MRTLLIDHHDSFTWNLAQALAGLAGAMPRVVAHDDPALLALDWSAFDAVVLSPGPGRPGRPGDTLYTAEALRAGRPPVLGVCLGMQLLAHAAGGRVVRAPTPRHGRVSAVRHAGDALFDGIPSPTPMVRYHSLCCVDLPDTLLPTAWAEDGVLMALRHRDLPQWGVQFHPESVASDHGVRVLANFLALAEAAGARGRPRGAGGAAVDTPDTFAARDTSEPPAPRAAAPLLHAVVPRAIDPEELHAAAFAGSTPSVWLDGAAAREGTRFSILGDATGPLAHWLTYRPGELTVFHPDGRVERRAEPLRDHVRRALGPRAAPPEGLDLPFALGFCGSLGYELRAELGSPLTHPSVSADAHLVFLDRAVVVDHAAGRTHLLALDHPENRAWLAATEALVATLPDEPADPRTGTPPVVPPAPGPVRWRHDHAAYRARIGAAQALLAEGESYELCLTNEARVPHAADPVATYRALRRLNPAPFAALLRFPGLDILSSSPERFLRVDRDRRVTAAPIKGTRRRAADPVADAEIAESLRTSEKDRSENLMIVDLLRNDLGRVCEVGSVRVPRLFVVERYATVHQLVSTIEGRLRADRDVLDLLAASFPPGSMTGAPKLRSMALLEELEGGPRGPYAGVVGYLSRCGGADLSVLIRAAVITDGVASVGVGGAIVALSDPDAEVAEMELKAEAVLRALGAH